MISRFITILEYRKHADQPYRDLWLRMINLTAGMSDLGNGGNRSEAYGINEARQVVAIQEERTMGRSMPSSPALMA